jgi:hypothetical protein
MFVKQGRQAQPETRLVQQLPVRKEASATHEESSVLHHMNFVSLEPGLAETDFVKLHAEAAKEATQVRREAVCCITCLHSS